MRKPPHNPWFIPFLVLMVVMVVSMMAILLGASQSSQDVRSRAFDDTQVIPNGQIPKKTNVTTGTPNPTISKAPYPSSLQGTATTGVPSRSGWPLLNQSPRPTPPVFPTRRPPKCNIVLQFMALPCVSPTKE